MTVSIRLNPVLGAGVLTLIGVTPLGAAQTPLQTYVGLSGGDYIGMSLDAGDIDGDGLPEIVLGAPWANNNGGDSGYARIHSGAAGHPQMWLANGNGNFAYFGASLEVIEDVNGDGYNDVLVGAYGEFDPSNSRTGVVRVISGQRIVTGVGLQYLYSVYGEQGSDEFGRALCVVGDIDGDTVDDFVVGARDANPGGVGNAGKTYVYSGVNGALLNTTTGTVVNDRFGFAVAACGDWDGDNVPDYIAGEPGDDSNGQDAGSAQVISGATGVVLTTFFGSSAGDLFGSSVSCGDVNGDGVGDVAVGAPASSVNGNSSGEVHIFAGPAPGSLLGTRFGDTDDQFGFSLDMSGDVNGDGRDDLLVGSPSHNGSRGRATLHLGGSLLSVGTLEPWGTYWIRLGWDVAIVPDTNGDGRDDVFVSGPYTPPGQTGEAHIYSGDFYYGGLGNSYCSPAVPNSTGSPGTITADGSPAVVDGDLALIASALPQGQFGYFLTGQSQGGFQPPGSQGFICMTGNIGRYNQPFNLGMGPTFSIGIDLSALPMNPVQAAVAGDTWYFQCWYRDGSTSNFTDGLAIDFR
ncbi:MAG: hypothetical protein GY711_34705 [bacterium]|nr:hypothetical protein [bacterium]